MASAWLAGTVSFFVVLLPFVSPASGCGGAAESGAPPSHLSAVFSDENLH